MTTLNRRKHGIPYRIVWFDPAPRWAAWPPTVYYQSPSAVGHPGLVRKPFHTLLTSLEGSPEDWLKAMNSTTRNEIRQADKAGIQGRAVSIADFLSFFNAFAEEKGIEGTSVTKLESFGPALRLTGAYAADRPLAMHAGLVDPDTHRFRLLLSASARFADPADRTLIGKANRWLHWWDMTTCRAEGLGFYDWGGYAKDTEDPAKQGINKFKDGFGGTLVEEAHYYPFYFAALAD